MKIIEPRFTGMASSGTETTGYGTPLVVEFSTASGSVVISMTVNPEVQDPKLLHMEPDRVKDLLRPAVAKIMAELGEGHFIL